MSMGEAGKYRSAHKTEKRLASLRIFFNYFGARDIAWHQIRGKLDSAKIQVQSAGEGRDGKRFGQARNPNGKTMATREQGDQHLLDHLLLADDHAVNLADKDITGLRHAVDGFRMSCGRLGARCCWHGSSPFALWLKKRPGRPRALSISRMNDGPSTRLEGSRLSHIMGTRPRSVRQKARDTLASAWHWLRRRA